MPCHDLPFSDLPCGPALSSCPPFDDSVPGICLRGQCSILCMESTPYHKRRSEYDLGHRGSLPYPRALAPLLTLCRYGCHGIVRGRHRRVHEQRLRQRRHVRGLRRARTGQCGGAHLHMQRRLLWKRRDLRRYAGPQRQRGADYVVRPLSKPVVRHVPAAAHALQ